MERANKPLTLEQLRGIDGQPVWIKDLKTLECSGWRMIYWDRGKYLVLIAKSIQGYILEEYGKTWLAYAQQPAHIDPETRSIVRQLMEELNRVTAERDAAQKLLAERSGVSGCGTITTCFGYPMDKVRELVESDRAGLCVAIPPRKLTEDEIMEAEKLNAKIGRIIGNAVVELFARKATEAAMKGDAKSCDQDAQS